MYTVFEYLTYLVLLMALAAVAFVVSAAVLIAERGAQAVAASTSKLLYQVGNLAAKLLTSVRPHPSHSPEQPN